MRHQYLWLWRICQWLFAGKHTMSYWKKTLSHSTCSKQNFTFYPPLFVAAVTPEIDTRTTIDASSDNCFNVVSIFANVLFLKFKFTFYVLLDKIYGFFNFRCCFFSSIYIPFHYCKVIHTRSFLNFFPFQLMVKSWHLSISCNIINKLKCHWMY